jgi:RNA polymerase sigma factor (sigma-70 family)
MPSPQQGDLIRHLRKLGTAHRLIREADRQLLRRFVADRDEAAFAALVQRHGTMVLGVCHGVLGHQQDAEDAFQATFLVLARKANAIRKQESVSSWLHGVAYRLALKAKTQAAKRHSGQGPPPPPLTEGPLEDLSVREWQAILHEELQRLPEKYRAALLLCYWEGKTRDEAAGQLGLARGTLREQLERARNLLRSRLVRRGLTPSVALFATLFSHHSARAISSTLAANTIKAAVAFAGKSTPVGLVSAAALALAQGAIPTMLIKRWTVAAFVLVLLGGFAGGLGYLASTAGGGDLEAIANEAGKTDPGKGNPGRSEPNQNELADKQASRPRENEPRADVFGDPLPPGALARLGTVRFRQGLGVSFIAFSADLHFPRTI